VVRNHAGGTRMGIGVPISKVATGTAETQGMLGGNAGRRSNWESDSSIAYDGGAIFGQPHERKPGLAAGSQGPKRVGKVGVKVRRVARARTEVLASGPVEGPRWPKSGDALQGRRAAVNGQGAATSIGVLPPQVVPVECDGVARTMPQRESAASTGVNRCFGSRFRTPRREEEESAGRQSRP